MVGAAGLEPAWSWSQTKWSAFDPRSAFAPKVNRTLSPRIRNPGAAIQRSGQRKLQNKRLAHARRIELLLPDRQSSFLPLKDACVWRMRRGSNPSTFGLKDRGSCQRATHPYWYFLAELNRPLVAYRATVLPLNEGSMVGSGRNRTSCLFRTWFTARRRDHPTLLALPVKISGYYVWVFIGARYPIRTDGLSHTKGVHCRCANLAAEWLVFETNTLRCAEFSKLAPTPIGLRIPRIGGRARSRTLNLAVPRFSRPFAGPAQRTLPYL